METVEMDLMQAQIGCLATDVSRLEAKVAGGGGGDTPIISTVYTELSPIGFLPNRIISGTISPGTTVLSFKIELNNRRAAYTNLFIASYELGPSEQIPIGAIYIDDEGSPVVLQSTLDLTNVVRVKIVFTAQMVATEIEVVGLTGLELYIDLNTNIIYTRLDN